MTSSLAVTHDPNVWMLDRREIIAARLSTYPYGGPDEPGYMLASDGWEFQRFERNGDMAPLPFLRCTHRAQATIEAPLVRFDWVQFGEVYA